MNEIEKAIEFDINKYVRVKLTTFGIRILKHQHDELNKHVEGKLGMFELKLDKDGWYRDQMWSLMQTFGKYTGLAMPQPFETQIQFLTSEQNEPLTLEELKKLGGEPIWVENLLHPDFTNWLLFVGEFQHVGYSWLFEFSGSDYEGSLDAKDYGKTWTAYRNKHK